MPEAPEVHVITDQLRLLIGKELRDIEVTAGSHDKFAKDIATHLKPILRKPDMMVKFQNVQCKGKFIYFTISLYKKQAHEPPKAVGMRYIGNHLGMTGNWRKSESKHTLVKFSFSDVDLEKETESLYFDDMRRFGKFTWLTRDQLIEKLEKLGPDILSDKFTEDIFMEIIKEKSVQNKMIGNVLMDQSVFSGIGNYLRADILYVAAIHPRKKIKDLSGKQLKKLYNAIRDVSRRAYESGGTTIKTYHDLEMHAGKYSPLIYGRETDDEGRDVETINLGGRTMWFVPDVQN